MRKHGGKILRGGAKEETAWFRKQVALRRRRNKVAKQARKQNRP